MIQTPKIDLLGSEQEKQENKNKHFLIKLGKFLFYFSLVLFISFFFFSSKIIFPAQDSVFASIKRFSQNYLFNHLQRLSSESNKLIGEENNRVNFLLYGIGGKGHPGGSLTDTIILASYQPSSQQLGLISIPRDLVVPIPNYGWRKINNLNAFGELDNPGHGGEYSTQFISSLLDLPVSYYFKVDFSGFEKLIDILGGVDIFVENTLDDYQYPIKGKENASLDERYEHLHIDQGWQHMDGQLALKYARSRHAQGLENSDFARSKRQQNILIACKEKLLSYNTLLNPFKIYNIIDTLNTNIETNITLTDLARIIEIARNFDNKKIINLVLDNGVDGPLIANSYDGNYVLEPRDNDFGEIKLIVQNIFDQKTALTLQNDKKTLLDDLAKTENQAPPKPTPPALEPAFKEEIKLTESETEKKELMTKEEATIEILNGTWINGLASANKLKLEEWGFTVINIGNASSHTYEKTIIYDLKSGQYPKTLAFLKEKFGGNLQIAPANLTSKADFVIILGQDTKK